MPKFADHVADALLAESNALGARWQAQARAVAPRVVGRPATPWRGVALVLMASLGIAGFDATVSGSTGASLTLFIAYCCC